MAVEPARDEASRIRVLLADDHAVLRAGLRALLSSEEDIEVVGEAGDGEETLDRARELRPDLIVMDIAMPGVSGLEAMRRIRGEGLPCRVLILTMHAETRYLLPVLEAGGSGYVLKSGADRELIEAIRTVSRGEVFLYPAAAKMLLEGYLERVSQGQERDSYDGLTDREREVLKLIAEGFSGTEIGERLVISPKTVDTYRERIMSKLKLRHRHELVRYALRKGLLTAEAGP